MAVTGAGGNYANELDTRQFGSRQAPSSSSMDMDGFMQLLAKQLENQDMSNPISNSEMMGQLTSMATVQAMNTFTELSTTQYALSLVGQEIKIMDPDEKNQDERLKTGKVTGINLASMLIYIDGNDKGYGLGNVMEVGKVPEKKPEEDDDGNTPGDGDENNKSRSAVGSYGSNQRSAPLPPDKQPAAENGYLPPDKAAALASQGSVAPDKAAALEEQKLRGIIPADKAAYLAANSSWLMRNSQSGPGIALTGNTRTNSQTRSQTGPGYRV